MQKVKDIMTKVVISVTTTTSVTEVAQVLFDNHLTGVPVTDHDKLVGIITEADLVRRDSKIHLPQFISILDSIIYLGGTEHEEEDFKKMAALKAKDIMNKNVITINEDDSVQDLATMMIDEKVNPVPVLGKRRQITGIVSRSDLVKLIATHQDI